MFFPSLPLVETRSKFFGRIKSNKSSDDDNNPPGLSLKSITTLPAPSCIKLIIASLVSVAVLIEKLVILK